MGVTHEVDGMNALADASPRWGDASASATGKGLSMTPSRKVTAGCHTQSQVQLLAAVEY